MSLGRAVTERRHIEIDTGELHSPKFCMALRRNVTDFHKSTFTVLISRLFYWTIYEQQARQP